MKKEKNLLRSTVLANYELFRNRVDYTKKVKEIEVKVSD